MESYLSQFFQVVFSKNVLPKPPVGGAHGGNRVGFVQHGHPVFNFFFRDYPQVFVPCALLAVSCWFNCFIFRWASAFHEVIAKVDPGLSGIRTTTRWMQTD